MTEIRIRHENDTDATRLTEVPFDQLHSIIPTLHVWGISVDYTEPIMQGLTGQFVYLSDVGETFFEIVIHNDDE
jgi:hypothetical protein